MKAVASTQLTFKRKAVVLMALSRAIAWNTKNISFRDNKLQEIEEMQAKCSKVPLNKSMTKAYIGD